MRKATGFGFKEIYVEVSHNVNRLIMYAKFLQCIIKIALKLFWRIVLSIDDPTNNVLLFESVVEEVVHQDFAVLENCHPRVNGLVDGESAFVHLDSNSLGYSRSTSGVLPRFAFSFSSNIWSSSGIS